MNSRTNYSNFWFDRQTSLVDDFLADDDTVEVKVKPQKDHIQLAANQRAVGNFVRIVSGQNIPVRYMTRGDSYTDGKSVTIAGNIKPAHCINCRFTSHGWKLGSKIINQIIHHGTIICEAKIRDIRVTSCLVRITKDNGANAPSVW